LGLFFGNPKPVRVLDNLMINSGVEDLIKET
jgi:hypothetical protein